jgi:enoyl-CoA hydratase/carnithine racemase
MPYETISTDLAERIFTITLDRPEKLNAFTVQMKDELIDAFDFADNNDDVRAVIVTGRGRAFCAGADISAGESAFDYSHTDAASHRDEGGLVTLRIYELKKPIIAAVNGPAVGVGATMTLAMDVRMAADDARFGFVFARRGLVPEAASSWFLPRAVGMSRALEWVFSGRIFPAQEALAAGLVRSLHPKEELVPAARALAAEIAANTSAVAVGLARQMLWRLSAEPHPMAAHRIDSLGTYYLGQSADVREGVASFFERRPPAFPLKVSADMPPHVPWWEDPPFRP